jgi:hypothetical protein
MKKKTKKNGQAQNGLGKKSEYQRLIIDLGYIIRANDEKMEQKARDLFYKDIMHSMKYGQLFDSISLTEAPYDSGDDIPEFLLEGEGHE